MRKTAPLLPLLFVCLPAPAQERTGDWDVRLRWEGAAAQQYLGAALAGPGDLDGDGVPDLLIGSRDHRVWLMSGADGSEVARIDSPAPPDLFGSVVAVSHDLDGDGTPDFLVGAPRMDPGGRQDAGLVVLHSGRTAAELRRLEGVSLEGQFGAALAALGDLDGDGLGDFAVGSPGETAAGHPGQAGAVRVYSAGSGAILWTARGGAFAEHFGAALAAMPDVDGDGAADLLVGAPDASPNGLWLAGYVELRSGADGGLLARFEGPDLFGNFGAALAPAGDADGDGIEDVLVGAPRAAGPNGIQSGLARLYSGATGALLHTHIGPAPWSWFGGAVAAVGDVDGDGRDDQIIGGELAPWAASGTPTGLVKVVSGRTGATLFRHDGFKGRDRFGHAVAGLGDIDGDGRPDYAIGSMESDVLGSALYDAGSVYLHSGADGSLLQQIDGDSPSQRIGSSLAPCPDLDGDGVGELLVGALTSSATLWSSRGWTPLFAVTEGSDGDGFGRSAAALGDVDGDGVGDFAIGAYTADPQGMPSAGSVFVHSGATRQLLYRLDGDEPYAYFGTSLAAVGDLDRDGVRDLAVGAPDADPGGRVDAGWAAVYSGVDGRQLQRRDGEMPGDRLGISVAPAGDFDADGRPDWMAGAYWADPAGENSGAALVYSGRNSRVLARLSGEQPWDYFGWAVSAAGDLDGDGYDDVIVGAKYADPGGRAEAGRVHFFRGPSGARLGHLDGADVEDTFGNCVLGGLQLDGDDVPDFAIGSKYHDVNGMSNAGSVFLYSGASFELLDRLDGAEANDELGKALAAAGDLDGDGLDELLVEVFEAKPNGPSSGEVQLFGAARSPWISLGRLTEGTTAELVVRRATPGALVRTAWSVAGGGPTGSPWGSFRLSPPVHEMRLLTADADGRALLGFPVPSGTLGRRVWFQSFEPASGAIGNGLSRVVE